MYAICISNKEYIFQLGKTSTVAILKEAGVSLLDGLLWASRGTKAGADMVRLLLSCGADIESRDRYYNTPLVIAVRVSLNFFLIIEKFHICSCFQKFYYHLSLLFHMCAVYHNYERVVWD